MPDGLTDVERELRLELEARAGEADWLRSHYDEHLRRAYARIAVLEAELAQVKAAAAPAADMTPRAEYDRLRAEVERLTAAEQRYIDRIEELKLQAGSR